MKNTKEVLNIIKKICKNMDTTNSNEVDIELCNIIDLCDKTIKGSE